MGLPPTAGLTPVINPGLLAALKIRNYRCHFVLGLEFFFLNGAQGHVIQRQDPRFRTSNFLFQHMVALKQSLKILVLIEKRLNNWLVIFEHKHTIEGC